MSPTSQGHLLQTDASFLTNGRLSDLASKALSEVAARVGEQSAHNASNTPLAERLLHAAMSRSNETLGDATEHLIAQGVPAEVIVDDVIPRAARLMGEEWVQDVSGFANVTLGASRLQTLVRKIGARWRADSAQSNGSTVLLWVPECAQHTLGPTILSTQLRRMGHSVLFSPNGSLAELSETLKHGFFDAVLVSASASETPNSVANIVERVKAHNDRLLVVAGGTILKKNSDLAERTGADVTTNDLEYASSFFSVAK